MRRTKIIATLGPASDSTKVIKQLVNAGLDVARLNMSHGDHATQKKRIDAIRSVDPNMAILIDLQGPKIRTGVLKGGIATLHSGGEFIITTKKILGNEKIVSTTYTKLSKDVKPGDCILIDDGLIKLKVIKVRKDEVHCKVVNGGVLKDHKGLNLPGVKISESSFTAKDRKDLYFAIKERVDYVALSFVRYPEDVIKLKKILKNAGAAIPVIAKIEKPEALKNLDEIIKVSDGIMVARGDLGVEMLPEKVPVIQKDIINRCNFYAKLVITATQMLETMVVNPRPTRAEASDVANAVYDGTDALMLSEEVAVGKYPVQSVKTMVNIIKEVEKVLYTKHHEVSLRTVNKTIASAVSHAACHTAEELNANAIITFTSSGSTALLVSKFKTDVPVYAVTNNERTMRKVRLYFGVTPVFTKRSKSTDEMILAAERCLLKAGFVRKGDLVVLVAGIPTGISGTTNLIKVHKIGEAAILSR